VLADGTRARAAARHARAIRSPCRMRETREGPAPACTALGDSGAERLITASTDSSHSATRGLFRGARVKLSVASGTPSRRRLGARGFELLSCRGFAVAGRSSRARLRAAHADRDTAGARRIVKPCARRSCRRRRGSRRAAERAATRARRRAHGRGAYCSRIKSGPRCGHMRDKQVIPAEGTCRSWRRGPTRAATPTHDPRPHRRAAARRLDEAIRRGGMYREAGPT